MSAYSFTERSEAAISAALQLARDHAHPELTPTHLELALPLAPGAPQANGPTNGKQLHTGDSLFRSVLSKAGVDADKVEQSIRDALRKIPQQSPLPDEITFSRVASKILKDADKLKTQQHDSFIAQDHILLALIDGDSNLQATLKAAGLANTDVLKTAITQARGARRIDSKASEAGFDALNKYTTDLTALAMEGKLDPVIGRDDEIRRVVRILSRRTKNNAVLIGEVSGRTACDLI